MIRELQLRDWGVIIGVMLLLLGGSGVFLSMTVPADHARVTVTSTGVPGAVENPSVVPYDELGESSKPVFREGVRREGFVDEPMSDVTELRSVSAVSLDGEAYAVRVSENEKPVSFGAIAVGGIVFSIAGFMSVVASLKRINVAARDVFVGVSAVVFAVALIAGGGYMFTVPSSDGGVGVSTTPVPASSVTGEGVVSASVLTPGEREAVYDVVGGGAAVPASEASYVRVEELRRVAGEFGYVQTDGEYYKLRGVDGVEWPRDVVRLALFVGSGVVIGGRGTRLVWESRYAAG